MSDMKKFNTLIPYMEVHDFDSDGNLKNLNGVVVILVWASWCPHCQHIKPAYADAAEQLKGKVLFVCAQQDGDKESEKKCVELLSRTKDIKGFPSILLYKNGKMVKKHNGDRSVKGLIDFAKSI